MGGSRGSWRYLMETPWVTLSLGLAPHLCLSFLLCIVGFELAGGFAKVTDSSSLRTGQCCLVFGDFKAFDSRKPSALTPACTLPCLSFPGQFPLRLGSQP